MENRVVKRIFNVVVKVIESIAIFACIACCFINEYPTYHAAMISMESWPKFFLGGYVLLSFMGAFQYEMNSNYRIHARYNRNALAFAAGACAMALGKALIDDIGDALCIYEDIHTSTTISGWTSLFIMVLVVCAYGVWIFYKANAVSEKTRRKFKKIAILECVARDIDK